MTERIDRLSDRALARKAQMLPVLQETMRRRHATKVQRPRALTAAAALLGLVAVGFFLIDPSPQPVPSEPTPLATDSRSPAAPARVDRIATPPDILDRYAAIESGRITVLSDAALLAELKAIERPAGLIKVGGETRLSEQVVDTTLPIADNAGEQG